MAGWTFEPLNAGGYMLSTNGEGVFVSVEEAEKMGNGKVADVQSFLLRDKKATELWGKQWDQRTLAEIRTAISDVVGLA